MSIFFVAKLVSPYLCLHSHQIWKTGSHSKGSSALLEGRRLKLFSTLKLNNTGIGGAKNYKQKSGRAFIKYNSTYAYLSLSSHSTPSKQLLNVATKSVLTPNRVNETPLKLAKLQLKMAAGLNNVNGVRRQNYGELKNHRKWYSKQRFLEF